MTSSLHHTHALRFERRTVRIAFSVNKQGLSYHQCQTLTLTTAQPRSILVLKRKQRNSRTPPNLNNSTVYSWRAPPATLSCRTPTCRTSILVVSKRTSILDTGVSTNLPWLHFSFLYQQVSLQNVSPSEQPRRGAKELQSFR